MTFDEDGKNSLWHDAEQLELRQGMSFHLCLRHRLIAVLAVLSHGSLID
jgi:hypothetical protein